MQATNFTTQVTINSFPLTDNIPGILYPFYQNQELYAYLFDAFPLAQPLSMSNLGRVAVSASALLTKELTLLLSRATSVVRT